MKSLNMVPSTPNSTSYMMVLVLLSFHSSLTFHLLPSPVHPPGFHHISCFLAIFINNTIDFAMSSADNCICSCTDFRPWDSSP